MHPSASANERRASQHLTFDQTDKHLSRAGDGVVQSAIRRRADSLLETYRTDCDGAAKYFG